MKGLKDLTISRSAPFLYDGNSLAFLIFAQDAGQAMSKERKRKNKNTKNEGGRSDYEAKTFPTNKLPVPGSCFV